MKKFKTCTVQRFDTTKLIPSIRTATPAPGINISIGDDWQGRRAYLDTLNNIRTFDQACPSYIAKSKSKHFRAKFNRLHRLLNQNPNPHNRRVARVLQSLSRLVDLHIRRMTGA